MPEKDKKFAKKYLGHKNDKKLCFEIVKTEAWTIVYPNSAALG